METTTLSSKGQVIMPKLVRTEKNWQVGQEFDVVITDEGVLFTPKAAFAATKLEDVAGCLKADTPAKSDADIEAAMKKAARSMWRDSEK